MLLRYLFLVLTLLSSCPSLLVVVSACQLQEKVVAAAAEKFIVIADFRLADVIALALLCCVLILCKRPGRIRS